jgi:hypothetical protein
MGEICSQILPEDAGSAQNSIKMGFWGTPINPTGFPTSTSEEVKESCFGLIVL